MEYRNAKRPAKKVNYTILYRSLAMCKIGYKHWLNDNRMLQGNF